MALNKESFNDFNQEFHSKIIGIQFSIMSPEEIIKNSVCEVKSKDTYINNHPVIHGLFDPRMGILDPGLICPTDGNDYIKCPGYFGHIVLAAPVFYIQYFNQIMKIVRCICIKCSKLLISKDKYKYLLNKPNEERWNKVFSLASKVKRCGDESEDGCGCKQPTKLKKEGFVTFYAEWDGGEGTDNEKLIMKLSADVVLKIFKRMTDEDIHFLGYSPIFSRPEWMICQVFAIPPPSMRPSVKSDGQQRQEDDITHIIINIIKYNQSLLDKIETNAQANVINDHITLLQYYIATLSDNKIPGAAPVSQRSGRPLKSIKDRLNGKTGRVRGNLMGKRVDYSARSVITPDPRISIEEVGVPLKIAMNITKPITVTAKNKHYLIKFVKNGPDVYPGAKMLDKKGKGEISLKYIDRNSIRLNEGDIVHRHMLDGDWILFNRQPTLHRMSMIGHKAKVLTRDQSNSFRLHINCTKPYNADFDGDEMNLHMPQDDESELELTYIAAVKNQIISPQNNEPIITFLQDACIGSSQFTRENVEFDIKEAMNLLMANQNINTELLLEKFKNKQKINSFEIISGLLPPVTINMKTNFFKDSDDPKTSNGIIEIKNGQYLRGRLSKQGFGSSSKGILHRIFKDFSADRCVQFLNELNYVVNEYIKMTGFSVGINDLLADSITEENISKTLKEKVSDVMHMIHQTHLGIFENKKGNSNQAEFEETISDNLNSLIGVVGKIALKSLHEDNRFVKLVQSGSKGSDLNISQMISCLGQQSMENKRVPYGYDNRTLPHFTKYDDSPKARGFITSSFASGLDPTELFFHAMAGRVGLIDTAVRTSQTGYISRRLIKSMEDLMVCYDMSVRNNKNKIIQFSYGGDSFDSTQVEKQTLPLIKMTMEEVYTHITFPPPSKETNKIINTLFNKETLKRYQQQIEDVKIKYDEQIEFFLKHRDDIVKYVYQYNDQINIYVPVHFDSLIHTIANQIQLQSNSLSDITPFELYDIIHRFKKERLTFTKYIHENILFDVLYSFYLTPKYLIVKHHFSKIGVHILLEQILLHYKKAIVNPGEMVGVIAAQSIGEVSTQLTLNTFHSSGISSKANVTGSLPRLEEILSITENLKNPTMEIRLWKEDESNLDRVKWIKTKMQYTTLNDIVKETSIYYDVKDSESILEKDRPFIKQYQEFEKIVDDCFGTNQDKKSDKSKWIFRMEMSPEKMIEHDITMDDIYFTIKNIYKEQISCIYSDFNNDQLVFRIRINLLSIYKKKTKTLDQSDEMFYLTMFQDTLMNNIILKGLKEVRQVTLREIKSVLDKEDGKYKTKNVWVLDTLGGKLMDLFHLDYIDVANCVTDNIQDVYHVLGIEAARVIIMKEIAAILENNGSYVNQHHIELLADRMTCKKSLISIVRHGINNDNIGPIAKASFEETPEMFLKAARHAELDEMRGVSANIMCGQHGYYGTSSFQTILDLEKIKESGVVGKIYKKEEKMDVEKETQQEKSNCEPEQIKIYSNYDVIKPEELGQEDDYMM